MFIIIIIVIIVIIILFFSYRKKESFKNIYKSAAYLICKDIQDKWYNIHLGSLNFLGNHHIKCKEGHILKGLQLETKGKQARYNYKCCKIVSTNEKPVILDIKNKSTPLDISGNYDATYLDKHHLNCKDGLINSMKLNTSYGSENPSEKLNTINYDYSCVYPNVEKLKMEYVCVDKETELTEESKNFSFLNRHKIECDKHQGLNNLQLVRDGKGKWQYKYRCCSIGML